MTPYLIMIEKGITDEVHCRDIALHLPGRCGRLYKDLDRTGLAEVLNISDAYEASSSISYDDGKQALREESVESIVRLGEKQNKGLLDLIVVTTTCKRSPDGRDAGAKGMIYRFDGIRYDREGASKKRYEAKCG